MNLTREALAGEVENYEILSDEGEVTCYETLASEDNNCIAPAVKDGQQFVTTEGFEEDNLDSKAKYNKRNLMLDMSDPSTHSMASPNNNQVGKQARYEACYRPKEKLCMPWSR